MRNISGGGASPPPNPKSTMPPGMRHGQLSVTIFATTRGEKVAPEVAANVVKRFGSAVKDQLGTMARVTASTFVFMDPSKQQSANQAEFINKHCNKQSGGSFRVTNPKDFLGLGSDLNVLLSARFVTEAPPGTPQHAHLPTLKVLSTKENAEQVKSAIQFMMGKASIQIVAVFETKTGPLMVRFSSKEERSAAIASLDQEPGGVGMVVVDYAIVRYHVAAPFDPKANKAGRNRPARGRAPMGAAQDIGARQRPAPGGDQAATNARPTQGARQEPPARGGRKSHMAHGPSARGPPPAAQGLADDPMDVDEQEPTPAEARKIDEMQKMYASLGTRLETLEEQLAAEKEAKRKALEERELMEQELRALRGQEGGNASGFVETMEAMRRQMEEMQKQLSVMRARQEALEVLRGEEEFDKLQAQRELAEAHTRIKALEKAAQLDRYVASDAQKKETLATKSAEKAKETAAKQEEELRKLREALKAAKEREAALVKEKQDADQALRGDLTVQDPAASEAIKTSSLGRRNTVTNRGLTPSNSVQTTIALNNGQALSVEGQPPRAEEEQNRGRNAGRLAGTTRVRRSMSATGKRPGEAGDPRDGDAVLWSDIVDGSDSSAKKQRPGEGEGGGEATAPASSH